MKKILFLLFLILNFSFAIGTSEPVCPDGQVLVLQSSEYKPDSEIYTVYKDGSSNYRDSGYNSYWLYFVYYRYSSSHVYNTYPDRTDYAFDVTIETYSCSPKTCPTGQKWDFSNQVCKSDCPTGTVWNDIRQVCTKCQPWQKENTLLLADFFGDDECVDMCDYHDTYVPSHFGDFIDNFAPFSPRICKNTNPATTPAECSAQGKSYSWKCSEGVSNKYWRAWLAFNNYEYKEGCKCFYNGYSTPIFANPSSLPGAGGFMPKTSNPFFDTPNGPRIGGRNGYDNLIPDRNPEGSYTGYSENSNTPNYNLADNFADWVGHDGSTVPRTSTGEPDIYGRNYDYIDTEIYHDPVTGRDTYIPKFEPTGTNDTGSINLTSNSFSNTASTNLSPELPSTYPNTNFSNPTPELFEASYQTSTKTQFNFDIPEPNLGDTVNVTANVPTSVAGSTPPTTRAYPMTVTGRTANSTGGYTTTYSYPSSVPGVPSYTVTTDSFSNDTTEVTVETSTNLNDGTNVYYTHRTVYSYTVPTSGGAILSYGNSSSSFTSPDGSTTYTNPTTNTGTTYNYQGSPQNLDELLNFKPAITETALDKPLDEMIKEEYKSISYIDSLKNNFLDVKLSFDNLFLKLQNKPTIHEKSGTCQVCFSFHGSVICEDWCQFFSPYRSLVTAFLIVVGTFFIGRFAVENLKN